MCASSEDGLHVMGIQLPIVAGMPVKVSALTGRRPLKSFADTGFRAVIYLLGRPGRSRTSVVDTARNGNSARTCAGSDSNRRSPAKKRRNRGSCSGARNMTATSELRRRCRCGQRRNSAGRATEGRSDMIREFVRVRSSVAGTGALFGEAEVVQLSMARYTLLPLIRQVRGIFQPIIRAKACWTRARTRIWERRVPVSRRETPRCGEPWDGPLPRVRLCGGLTGRGRPAPGCAGVRGVHGI